MTKEELQEFIKTAVEDKEVLEKVRNIFKEALSEARVRNWLHGKNKKGELRGFPDLLAIGAGLYISLQEKRLSHENDIPKILIEEHKNSLSRTQMWADSAWHVFYVCDDKQQNEQDVYIWRFWEGLRSTIEIKYLSHTSLTNGRIDETEVLQHGKEDTVVKKNGKQITFQVQVGQIPQNVGYKYIAINSQKSYRDTDTQTHEFLGGTNWIPTMKTYYIVSIPVRFVGELTPPLFSFASSVTPLELFEILVNQGQIDQMLDLNNKESQLLQPWVKIEEVRLTPPLKEEIPLQLYESVNKIWKDFPKVEQSSRRFLFSIINLPSPLVMHSFIYRLGENQL